MGIFLLTITTSPEINVSLESNSSIVLNCTFELDANEGIRNVYWGKKLHGTNYNKLAEFAYKNAIYNIDHGLSLENRSNLHSFSDTSQSAILNITDVRCEDVGQYQCEVEFSVDSKGKTDRKYTDVYIQANAERPTTFSVHPNNSLEEHEILNIACVAVVGSPHGSLAIWEQNVSSNTLTLLKNTSKVFIDTDNCTSVANLTITYKVSRHNNGAKFMCSSRNKFTKEPAPAAEFGPIKVLYGPSNTRVNSFDLNAPLFIKDSVILECISDGNPNPIYAWKFNHSSIGNNSKFNISADKSKLSFTVTNISDSGLYQCVAYNYIKGNMFNSSSNVTITVQERHEEDNAMEIEKTCLENPCLFIQNCIMRNGSAFCSINIWAVVAIAFIFLTLILGTITLMLIISKANHIKRINRKKRMDIGDVHVSYTREKFEDFGGYADPKDVKRPENGQIKLDKDVRDNPYADPVDFQTQYAVVQKTWETPAKSSKDTNSSDTSNLLNNTDSSNTGNPSSSTETTNLKNLSSDEKTSASTETSETIPKPPNVGQTPTNYINLLLD
uniref:Ig-like domain-containing protein n=2 Tax=Magallana gigas TaxID=29159 RepID=A0A8W8NL16_MAGGI